MIGQGALRGESLQLTSHLAAQLPTRAVLVGAIRDRVPVPGPQQAHALAELSRQPMHRRIRLRPLRPDDVAAIVRDETGHDLDPDVARIIHERSGGNPFFTRELARLLAEGGPLTTEWVARSGVPASVRDVVVDRMAELTGEAERALDLAEEALDD